MKLQKSLAVGLLGATAMLGAAIPASATADEPNLSVLARFDKLTYQPGETAAVSFKFRNWGPVDAVKVANDSGGAGSPSELEITDWGGVRYNEGITIRAGETVTVVLHGIVPTAAANVGKVAITLGFTAENGDSDPSNNIGDASASVPGATGTLTGDILYDSNGNNQRDPGEGFEGLKITLVGLYDIERIVTAYSDQDGKFRFDDLPVGEYEMRLIPPSGWWLQYGGNVSSALVLASGSGSQFIQVEPIS
ncbi:hypothetical protein [Amycolatopsis sp.]|jgi:hypothetical protein|uniref:hypothetical protein n=1 Tax=Amycolatopsis sp. TaxID=37632 RepID=UPI002E0863AB|nr:hypothetical protein [Amycolatopsis sp.]